MGSDDALDRESAAPAASAKASPRITISGLQANVERMLARLSMLPGETELAEIHRAMVAGSGRVEALVRLHRVTPSQLSEKLRKYRGWLAYFADAEQFAAYNAALVRATPVMEAALAGHPRFRLPARLHFRPMRVAYRVTRCRDITRIEMPAASICFSAEDFAVVAARAFHRDADPQGRRRMLELMNTEAFQAIAAEITLLGGIVEETTGRFHDLGDSFDRVNAKYFNGAMKRPRLFWSRAQTMRKFGHYDWIGGSLMVSRTLDRADAPEFLVDFIMYHELLHQHHGIRWSGSRGYAHTADFYRDESRFERYAEAEAMLQKIATGQRRARRGE